MPAPHHDKSQSLPAYIDRFDPYAMENALPGTRQVLRLPCVCRLVPAYHDTHGLCMRAALCAPTAIFVMTQLYGFCSVPTTNPYAARPGQLQPC